MNYLAVKGFREHQHYRDRNPVWIKLYNRVMDDEAFLALPDAARAHLILIWLLASRRNNKLPNDAKLIARAIQASGRVNLAPLIAAGFLIPWSESLAECEQNASTVLAEPEQSARPEREGEKRREDSSSSAPPADELESETRLSERAPEAWPVISRFLAGKEPTARVAWIGRFHGALDRPPHPTGADLRDALEDLMTQPREDWKPTLFRRYVERIRSDAVNATARQAERAPATSGTSDAGTTFAKIRALIETVNIPGRGSRPVLPRAKVEALGPRVLAAYDAIGGAERFLDPDEKIGFVLRDFTKEYGTLTGAHV